MLKVIQLSGEEGCRVVKQTHRRGEEKDKLVDARVAEILEQIRTRGDAVVEEYILRSDGVLSAKRELNREEMVELSKDCDPEFVAALGRAAQNIRDFHQRQTQQNWLMTHEDGVLTGQRARGLHHVGIYVPDGTVTYPSSVLMDAIPAKIAQMGEIIMATPPQKDGRPNPNIMAVALIAGVDRIFLMGGAQAAVALTYGTETVLRVDKIVGPDNIYVATAKKQLYGIVDIDMITGPSEIPVLVDETANPVYLATDLLSQAEHDVLASAILFTSSLSLAQQVAEELERQTTQLERREIMEQPLQNYGVILACDIMQEAVVFANSLAPEHPKARYENPIEYLGRIDNVGSVFLGNYSPKPLGDYYVGANHVPPIGGTARLFSPLSVDSFLKKSSFIYYTKQMLAAAGPDVMTLAKAEGLTTHVNSIKARV